jgi:hypothetical protein
VSLDLRYSHPEAAYRREIQALRGQVELLRDWLHRQAQHKIERGEVSRPTWRCIFCGLGFSGALVTHAKTCLHRNPDGSRKGVAK